MTAIMVIVVMMIVFMVIVVMVIVSMVIAVMVIVVMVMVVMVIYYTVSSSAGSVSYCLSSVRVRTTRRCWWKHWTHFLRDLLQGS